MRAFTMTLGLTAALATAARAGVGLTTQFVDVEFEGLQPGQTYNLSQLKGVPYTIRNRGGAPVEVVVEAQIPQKDRVEAPYEAIPDPSWVELTPSRMRIDEGSLGFSDLVLRVPNDPALKGRHFQVTLWAHTVKTGMMSVGVNSRVRFSIGAGPETAARKALEEAVVKLNYDVWPQALYLGKAKTGSVYDGKEAEGRQFLLTNRADADLELVPAAAPWPTASLPLPTGGWEAVSDLSWVRFEPSTVTVNAMTVKDFRIVLDNAPAALKGRKAAFLVQLRLPNGMVVNQTNRAFVTFPADEAGTISAPEAPVKK